MLNTTSLDCYILVNQSIVKKKKKYLWLVLRAKLFSSCNCTCK